MKKSRLWTRILDRVLPRVDAEPPEDDPVVAGVTALREATTEVLTLDHPTVLVPVDDRPCPDCSAKRCWYWRDSYHRVGCDNRPEPGNSYRSTLDAIANPGRHTLEYVVKHWASFRWNPIALRTRVRMAPTYWAQRIGRPVQIGLALHRVLP